LASVSGLSGFSTRRGECFKACCGLHRCNTTVLGNQASQHENGKTALRLTELGHVYRADRIAGKVDAYRPNENENTLAEYTD